MPFLWIIFIIIALVIIRSDLKKTMAIIRNVFNVCLLLGFILFSRPVYSETIASLRRPTVVIGFDSKLSNDLTAGKWFTRVTIRELQKNPVVRTPSADNVLSVMQKMGISPEQAYNPTNALKIAKKMECSQFILGSLEPEDSGKKVKVKFILYDAQDLEALVEDTVTVNSGIGLYDALDNFQKEIINALFDTSTLPAKLGLSVTTGKAFVSVNDSEMKEVEKGRFIWMRMKPKTRIKIRYYDVYSKMLLFNTNLVLLPDTEQTFEYRPSAHVLISGLPGAKITRPDGTVFSVSSNGRLETMVNALIADSLIIETREKTVKLEMTSKVNTDINIKAHNNYDPRKIDYSFSQPLWNLLIPGFAQYQANDCFLGSFFTLLAVGGMGLTGFGFYADGQMSLKAQQTTIPEDIRKFETYGELYRTMGYIGIGIWAISAIVSGGYAYWHPTRYINRDLPEAPISFYMNSGGVQLKFSFLFS